MLTMNDSILAFWSYYHYTSDRPQEGRNLNGSYKLQTKIVFYPWPWKFEIYMLYNKTTPWPTLYSFWTWNNKFNMFFNTFGKSQSSSDEAHNVTGIIVNLMN